MLRNWLPAAIWVTPSVSQSDDRRDAQLLAAIPP
jgi:hypothetical protein